MNYPPLPPYLTLSEAAQALTDRLGQQWTPRAVLGCATRNEISIFARIGHAVCLARVEPIEGEENVVIAEADSLPRISAKAARTLLLNDVAEFDELTYPRTVNLPGETLGTMVTVWTMAPGEVAPEIRLENCRVSDAGLLQLIDNYTASRQSQEVIKATRESPTQSIETPKQRRARYLALFETESRNEPRGALARVATCEGVDRSNLGKALEKARRERNELNRAGLMTPQIVRDGKRAG